MNPTIAICGAGGIGRAAALILACNNAMTPRIYIGDINTQSLNDALRWINEGQNRRISVETFLMPLQESNDEMDAIFQKSDVILDCLPGSQAPRIAAMAKKSHSHYANLTEYVAESDQIIEEASDAETGFILQTGLAPGYINLLACQLYNEFKTKFNNDKLESIKMRVGALSEHALSPYFYAYTWSPIGVATEYVKDAVVVKDYTRQLIPSLSGTETIIINGEAFEDNYTSGGAADLPKAFFGKVKNLDYKTIRYPGHYGWVKEKLKSIPESNNKSLVLDKLMQSIIPSVESDRVVIYAQVVGYDQNKNLRAIEKSYDIYPKVIGTKLLRAIQTTTASALCEAAYFLIHTNPKGVILQSQIEPLSFLNGPYVSEIYGKYE